MTYTSQGYMSHADIRDIMDDTGAPEYIKITTRSATARKEHKCTECSHPIKPGERYNVLVYKLDGDFFADKRHTYHWMY